MSEEHKYVTAWAEWHLTPTGWVCGTSKDEDEIRYEKPTPENRVLTLYHGHSGSEMRGKPTKTRTVWQTDDLIHLENLKEQFGSRPTSFW